MEQQQDTVPTWVLQEVGRLHLENLALRQSQQRSDEEQGTQ